MSTWRHGRRAIGTAGLICLVVGALAIYLVGVRHDAERSRLEPGLRACMEVMGVYDWLDYDGAEAHAAPTVEDSGRDLALVAGRYPRLVSLVKTIENSRRELLSGQVGIAARALSRECQDIGWRPSTRP